MSTNGWADVLWGRVSLTLATLGLAIGLAISGHRRPWWLIAAAGAFIVVHNAVGASRDKNIVRRLGRDYERVQRQLLQLVVNLGNLAAQNYALWMVDIYLPQRKWSLAWSWRCARRHVLLSREFSVALLDPRALASTLDPEVGPHGESFSHSRPILWFNESVGKKVTDNAWCRYEQGANAQLANDYGLLYVSPLANKLDKDCVGVLAVHVTTDVASVIQALGAINSRPGRQFIKNASIELNELLHK